MIMKHQHLHSLLLFTSFLLVVSNLPLQLHSLNQQGLYLLRAKHDLSDPSSSLSDWNPKHDFPCNWTGITCNNNSLVTSISLDSLSLDGPFPAILCRLSSLSSLSLSDNFINSTLSHTIISTCVHLTYLDLSENLLEGPLPSSLSSLPNLVYLNLSGNSFSGEIPASFGNFPVIETMVLSANLLTGIIPAVLGNLTSLKCLQLAYNPFSLSRLAPELGNMSSLETIWVSGNNLIGEIPDSFTRLSRLTDLDVSNNKFTGPIPSWIFQLTSLVQIEFFNNSFTGELLPGWSNLTSLRRFDVSTNKFTGTIPDELTQLPLESLNLYHNQLEGLLPENIALSPNLFELRIFNNRLTGSLPSQLGKNCPLGTIDVTGNSFSGRIPESICEKGVLEELILLDNMFSGNIPESIVKCRSLSRVRLGNNRLSGEVPVGLWGLPHVFLLDLHQNSFSGNISHLISGAFNLSTLMIAKNQFSGSIPNEVGLVGNLIEFSANGNRLSGSVPEGLFNLGKLETLDLNNNEISGEIPVGIRGLKELNELNLANNRLSGKIPDEIGELPVLNYLDLSGNSLSGKIPDGLQNLKLNKLNLSNNQLTGNIPSMYAKEVYKDSFIGNPGLCGDDPLGICPKHRRHKNSGNSWVLVFIFVIAGIVLIVGFVWFVFKYRKFRKIKKKTFVVKWRSFHKLSFSELDIVDCLKEDNVIGTGASGKVYKAMLGNGEVVAVKKLWERSIRDDTIYSSADSMKDEFESEVETLGRIRHKNIVRLWCCCNAGKNKLLVYEYMPNGSLGDVLHSAKGGMLDWPTRLKIALDAAEGLSYLHHDCDPSIVHRDVKSNNILLDEDFGARIADFGVAKFIRALNKGPESMSVIAGSCGYIAPEYAYTLRVNEKSDTYSFGVVLLELVTGKAAIDQQLGEKDLATWVCSSVDQKGVDLVIDPNLDSHYKEQICKVLDIGIVCISPLPINRPSMRRVVKMLQEAATDPKPKATKNDGKLSPYYYEDVSDQASLV
ncbi:receptor-like protein kinase HSL1 [Heracleum sosnowskyi]|uniref:non-specific serine/threonine protein kinase n=1 Tax=Heracleum sosnowskyi TaxID=360622 RepID=A0AAD8NDV6_9APIA|nr:receptor-like protein kinase HSL1 [Heracleum sosnowskyi]